MNSGERGEDRGDDAEGGAPKRERPKAAAARASEVLEGVEECALLDVDVGRCAAEGGDALVVAISQRGPSEAMRGGWRATESC